MKTPRETLERLENTFPDVQAFLEPFKEAYHDDVSSGKTIDLANAIYESVGKNAWKSLPTAPVDKKIENAMAPQALKEAERFFLENDPNFTEEIYNAVIGAAGRILGHRSTSGNISHGHLHTKEEIYEPIANLSLNLSLSLACYYLDVHELGSGKLNYDDYRDAGGFNEWLDEQGQMIGGTGYSMLIYLYDYPEYERKFEAYQALISNIYNEGEEV